MPFFSVVIPNYNHGRFLEKRIQSVLQQSLQDFELIILDDSSTDNSIEIIEQFRKHQKISHIVYNQHNSGSPFKQWAKGIGLAKGEWIWIAESDDEADKDFLGTAANAINAYPSVGLFYCDAILEKGSAQVEKFSQQKNALFSTGKWNKDHLENGQEAINSHLKYYCTINNASSVVFKKELVDVNNDAFRMHYHGDWLFYLTVLSKTNLYYSAKPLNIYREHSQSHIKNAHDIVKRKTDYFRVLNFLETTGFVTDKNQLIIHFVQNYLGGGLLTDVFTIKTALLKFFSINKKLTLEVFKTILQLRLTGKKQKKRT
jgi:glycosyltransferase involved in cell wall biosynthesis